MAGISRKRFDVLAHGCWRTATVGRRWVKVGQRAHNENRVGIGVGMVGFGWQNAREYGLFCTFWVLSGNCGKSGNCGNTGLW